MNTLHQNTAAPPSSRLFSRTMDHHVLAAISLTGTIFDALGGFYLAYDLLGGKEGPLRTLSSVITYTTIRSNPRPLPRSENGPSAAGGIQKEATLWAHSLENPVGCILIQYSASRSFDPFLQYCERGGSSQDDGEPARYNHRPNSGAKRPRKARSTLRTKTAFVLAGLGFPFCVFRDRSITSRGFLTYYSIRRKHETRLQKS